MSQIVAPLQAKISVEITGEQFVQICKLQAAENAADRELLRESIGQRGQLGIGWLTLQTTREERRVEEARAESLAHQVRLAEMNAKAAQPPRRKKTTAYTNGVTLD